MGLGIVLWDQLLDKFHQNTHTIQEKIEFSNLILDYAKTIVPETDYYNVLIKFAHCLKYNFCNTNLRYSLTCRQCNSCDDNKCEKKHSLLCCFGSSCFKQKSSNGCGYRHADSIYETFRYTYIPKCPTVDDELLSIRVGVKSIPSTTDKKLCRYGKNCVYLNNCRYLHLEEDTISPIRKYYADTKLSLNKTPPFKNDTSSNLSTSRVIKKRQKNTDRSKSPIPKRRYFNRSKSPVKKNQLVKDHQEVDEYFDLNNFLIGNNRENFKTNNFHNDLNDPLLNMFDRKLSKQEIEECDKFFI